MVWYSAPAPISVPAVRPCNQVATAPAPPLPPVSVEPFAPNMSRSSGGADPCAGADSAAIASAVTRATLAHEGHFIAARPRAAWGGSMRAPPHLRIAFLRPDEKRRRAATH